jgi:hypothetical protein
MIEQKDLTAHCSQIGCSGWRDTARWHDGGPAARTFARPDAATAIVEKAVELSGCQERPDVFEIVS